MFDPNNYKKLPRSFYTRNLLRVANDLLGKYFVKQDGINIYVGKIVEVEAYDGSIDEAAHSFAGITKRTKIMFNEGGFLYVYLSYGVHNCCNVVTGIKGKGTAVLIRAIEPVAGINLMAINRFNKEKLTEKEKMNLTNGPGKLCKAFNIDRSYSGFDLTNSKIYLTEGEQIKIQDIGKSKRIGITKSIDLPWRYFIKNNNYLSRK